MATHLISPHLCGIRRSAITAETGASSWIRTNVKSFADSCLNHLGRATCMIPKQGVVFSFGKTYSSWGNTCPWSSSTYNRDLKRLYASILARYFRSFNVLTAYKSFNSSCRTKLRKLKLKVSCALVADKRRLSIFTNLSKYQRRWQIPPQLFPKVRVILFIIIVDLTSIIYTDDKLISMARICFTSTLITALHPREPLRCVRLSSAFPLLSLTNHSSISAMLLWKNPDL